MAKRFKGSFVLMFSLVATLSVIGLPRAALAQTGATPVPINLSSATPTPPPVHSPTPSRTPTNTGSAVAEALDKTIGANIRQSPDANSAKLGNIPTGKFYAILGKHTVLTLEKPIIWYLILYGLPNPDSTGWVYSEVVKVSGPVASIPEIKEIATINPAAVAAQSTSDSLTRTPGAPGSATALRLSATGVITANPNGTIEPTNGGPLPTFTYPPPIVEATLAPRLNTNTKAQGGVPPIIPILGLSVVGLLGLLISGLRRR